MTEKYKRAWDGKQWEAFSLTLIRSRHGPTNTQPIPDRVRGDWGVECLTSDGCCYQSFAPLEAADAATAASAMKRKATEDLKKLEKNAAEIAKVLNGQKISRWILFCPFLDDKAVVAHVATKAALLKAKGLDILSEDFEGKVHWQSDFSEEIDRLRQQAVGTTLDIAAPADAIVDDVENELDETLNEKLKRGFPAYTDIERRRRKRGFISTSMRAENAIEQLKRDAPELWERATTVIALEEDRLLTVGSIDEDSPRKIIMSEQDRLFEALRLQLPTISSTSVRAIASGQIGIWLIECPLDFSDADGAG